MAPLSLLHENDNRLLEVLIGVLVEELDLEIKRTGSVTCKREDLERGVETWGGKPTQSVGAVIFVQTRRHSSPIGFGGGFFRPPLVSPGDIYIQPLSGLGSYAIALYLTQSGNAITY
jgi:hypothetical protein